MGFWDALTGKGASKAMSRSTDALNRSLENQTNTVNSAYDAGLGAYERALSSADAAARGYGNLALGALGSGVTNASNYITEGRGWAQGYLDDARKTLDPYRASGDAASGMYSNALGLNGQSGKDAALGAFRGFNPGYQYSVDQATDQVARKAASLGMAASGNTMAAISDRAGHMADQNWGSWLDRLQGQQGMGMQAAGQQAGILGQQASLMQQSGAQLGSLWNGYGQNQAGVMSGLGSTIGGWNMALGQGENASWAQRGNTLGSLMSANAKSIADNYAGAAQATGAGAQNMLGLGLGALNTGLKAFGVGGF